MSTRVVAVPTGVDAHQVEKTEYEDTSFDQRETTVDGYTFHWSPNMKRNFLDDGVGLAHAAFKDADSDGVATYTIPNNNARS